MEIMWPCCLADRNRPTGHRKTFGSWLCNQFVVCRCHWGNNKHFMPCPGRITLLMTNVKQSFFAFAQVPNKDKRDISHDRAATCTKNLSFVPDGVCSARCVWFTCHQSYAEGETSLTRARVRRKWCPCTYSFVCHSIDDDDASCGDGKTRIWHGACNCNISIAIGIFFINLLEAIIAGYMMVYRVRATYTKTDIFSFVCLFACLRSGCCCIIINIIYWFQFIL